MTLTNEQIHEIETTLEHERPSQRYERLLACMAQSRVDSFERDGGCVGCYSFDDAVGEVLASPGGLTLYEKMLRARVRGQ